MNNLKLISQLHWLSSVLLVLIVNLLISCNNNSSNTAAPPVPSNQCLTGTVYNNGGCSNQVYANYNQYGFMPYPYGNTLYNNGYYGNSYVPYCNCPSGYRPVYNGSIGMGCVASPYFSPIAIGANYWSVTPNNYQIVNWNQVSSNGNTVGGYTNCYQNLAQSCFIDQINSCGSGYICRATAVGSRLGICSNF
ncbi:MAG: hypothetical protein L6Q37_04340 [Bdellovibrionaceae bacterium]|nr:hypothetical protein [Pseudobdellovibrionaceae bacterium]NUM57496.1 hypothetical protein [Pseudobdellovibrionaceae bacterium]